MKNLTKYIIAIIIGILLLAWGAYTFSLGVEGPGELDVITGKLELIAPAYDAEFDIEMDSPFLKRNVEMYQYYEDGHGYLNYGFFPDHKTVPKGDRILEYKNPPFPNTVKKAMFYGDVVIGEDKVHLAKEFLEKFSFESYVNFKEDNTLYQVVGLDGGDEVKGLHPEADEYYTNSYSDEWEIGDLMVYWQVVDPEDFAVVYTAAGRLEGDTLQRADNGSVFFYDHEMSAEEIAENFQKGNKTVGVVLMAIGIALIVLFLYKLIQSRKSSKAVAEPIENK